MKLRTKTNSTKLMIHENTAQKDALTSAPTARIFTANNGTAFHAALLQMLSRHHCTSAWGNELHRQPCETTLLKPKHVRPYRRTMTSWINNTYFLSRIALNFAHVHVPALPTSMMVALMTLFYAYEHIDTTRVLCMYMYGDRAVRKQCMRE